MKCLKSVYNESGKYKKGIEKDLDIYQIYKWKKWLY